MSAMIATGAPARVAKPWYKILYVQVLIAILLGVLVGWNFPILPPTTGSRRSATASSS